MSTQDKPIGRVKKDPSAVLNRGIDWSEIFATETITSQLWKVPAGLTKDAESMVSKVHYITISGGTVGEKYYITSQVTTASGQVDERSFEVTVLER